MGTRRCYCDVERPMCDDLEMTLDTSLPKNLSKNSNTKAFKVSCLKIYKVNRQQHGRLGSQTDSLNHKNGNNYFSFTGLLYSENQILNVQKHSSPMCLLTPSLHSGLCWNVTYSEFSLSPLPKMTHSPLCLLPCCIFLHSIWYYIICLFIRSSVGWLTKWANVLMSFPF